jgi:hypothetical protein
MLRTCVLSTLLIVAGVSVVVSAQPGFTPPPLRLEPLEDKLYMLHGGCMCGNTLFYIADGGVVMVDTKVSGQGEAILKQLRTVTDKPIAMIINTHTEIVANVVEGLKNVDTVISGHVEAYPWDDVVRYAEFHRNLETYALAGLGAGQSAASLIDFSFTEPFATNFIQLLSDEMSAR